MEEQAFHIQSIVHQISICAGTSLNAFDYDLEANQALFALLESVEVILNCMLILNYPKHYNNNMVESDLALMSPSDASRDLLTG